MTSQPAVRRETDRAGWLEEPPPQLGAVPALLPEFLDFYRDVFAKKLTGLNQDQLHATVLPSGWTPLELLKHVVYMERRWLVWGFLAEQVPDPFGDAEGDRWALAHGDTLDGLLARLRAGGERTSAIVAAHDLDTLAARGGRFVGDRPTPSLGWILLHVLQAYARHAGHLDAARELIDGATGE